MVLTLEGKLIAAGVGVLLLAGGAWWIRSSGVDDGRFQVRSQVNQDLVASLARVRVLEDEKRALEGKLREETASADKKLEDYRRDHPERPVRVCSQVAPSEQHLPAGGGAGSSDARADLPDVPQEPGLDIGPSLYPEADRGDRCSVIATYWQQRWLRSQRTNGRVQIVPNP